MSFAAGFFGTLSNNIENKRDFIRSRVEEDRKYLREQGLQRMAKVGEQRTAYETAARGLIRRGADESTVLTAMESDPQGILDIYREVDKNNITNPSTINSIFEIGNEYRTEASLSEVLNKILPTVSQLPADADPTTVRRKSFASWLNLDTEEELDEQVYGSQIVGGMTGDQILASMNIPVNAKGTDDPNVAFNFAAMERGRELSPGEVSDWFSRSLEEYEPLVVEKEQEINQQLVDLENDDTIPEEQKRAILAELKEQKEILNNLPKTKRERLEALLGVFGVLPNTQTYYDMYPELFSTKYGFDSTIESMFTGEDSVTGSPVAQPGDITTTELDAVPAPSPTPSPTPAPTLDGPLTSSDPQDAANKVEEYFQNNPTEPFVEVEINGEKARVENQDYFQNNFRAQPAPGILADGLDAVKEFISRRNEGRQALRETDDPTPSTRNNPELDSVLSEIVFLEDDYEGRNEKIDEALSMLRDTEDFQGKYKLIISLIGLREGTQ
jgi:hypothetical protein